MRSRGTAAKAVKVVTASDVKWADIVFAMEHKHLQRLVSQFPDEMKGTEAHVLDIPDDYQFMAPDLIAEIQSAVDPILANRMGTSP